MRCKIRSGTRRAQSKDKSDAMQDRLIDRAGSSGRSMYKFCVDDETTQMFSSGRAPRMTSWRRGEG